MEFLRLAFSNSEGFQYQNSPIGLCFEILYQKIVTFANLSVFLLSLDYYEVGITLCKYMIWIEALFI